MADLEKLLSCKQTSRVRLLKYVRFCLRLTFTSLSSDDANEIQANKGTKPARSLAGDGRAQSTKGSFESCRADSVAVVD